MWHAYAVDKLHLRLNTCRTLFLLRADAAGRKDLQVNVHAGLTLRAFD